MNEASPKPSSTLDAFAKVVILGLRPPWHFSSLYPQGFLRTFKYLRRFRWSGLT